MTVPVPCPIADRSGQCTESVAVELDGDRLAGYTAPCNHALRPAYLRDEALRISAEAGPAATGKGNGEVPPAEAIGQPPQTPDPESGAVGAAATERAGATLDARIDACRDAVLREADMGKRGAGTGPGGV